jgi:hypothetical protein
MVAFARPVDSQENLLSQVFSGRRVARHAVHKAHHRPAVFLHQILESSVIARSDPQHHLGIGQAIARHRGLGRYGMHRARHREQPAIHGYAAHI